jgi:aspartate/methionine/tyrosine aminotransferase
MFSSRTCWNLAPNRLSTALASYRRAGRVLRDLTESNPTRAGFDYPDAAIREALSRAAASPYQPDPRGWLPARELLADRCRRAGLPAEPDRMLLTASTSEAYAYLFRLLADPGDAILVPRPSYPLFGYLAGLNDLEPIPYPLRYGNGGWRIDLEALRGAVTGAVRAVVVVHPNNPTGSFVREEEQAALRELCRYRGLALIADEVFADYAYGPGPVPPRFGGREGPLTFALGGLSKYAGLPQMKLAWIVAGGPDAQVREAMARLDVISDTYLSVATPVQRALPSLLDLSDGIRASIRERVSGNRRTVDRLALASRSVRVLAADGGWYAVLSGPEGRDDEAWSLDLLEREGVLVHPGHFYDFEADGHLVVSLLPEPGLFCDAMSAILALSS